MVKHIIVVWKEKDIRLRSTSYILYLNISEVMLGGVK